MWSVMFCFDFAVTFTQTLDFPVLLNIALSMVDFYHLGKSRETIRNGKNCAGWAKSAELTMWTIEFNVVKFFSY